jgi:hypothetical protein
VHRPGPVAAMDDRRIRLALDEAHTVPAWAAVSAVDMGANKEFMEHIGVRRQPAEYV